MVILVLMVQHYRGVAEIAFAQGVCLFAETFTKGLHKGLAHLHRLPQGACTLCAMHRLEQGLALLHRLARGAFKIAQRLAQAAATWRGDGETLKMS